MSTKNGNNWREIAAQAWCDETTKTVEMDVRLAAVFADMLEKAYRLGVTNATGILRQNEITEKEAEEEGYRWTRTFPQETADGIEEVLLSNVPHQPPAFRGLAGCDGSQSDQPQQKDTK